MWLPVTNARGKTGLPRSPDTRRDGQPESDRVQDRHRRARRHPVRRHPARQHHPGRGRHRHGQDDAGRRVRLSRRQRVRRARRHRAVRGVARQARRAMRRCFGWDLPELERQQQLKIIFTTRQVFQQELQQADSLLLDEASKIGARRIFVDGLAGCLPARRRAANRARRSISWSQGLQRENLTAMLALEAAALTTPGRARCPRSRSPTRSSGSGSRTASAPCCGRSRS